MSKHNCPDCKCQEVICENEEHCIHIPSNYYNPRVVFCCRCDYRYQKPQEDCLVSGNSTGWPPPGCKLEIVIT